MENKRVARTRYLRVDTTKHISYSFHRGKRKKKKEGKKGKKEKKIGGKKSGKKKNRTCVHYGRQENSRSRLESTRIELMRRSQ